MSIIGENKAHQIKVYLEVQVCVVKLSFVWFFFGSYKTGSCSYIEAFVYLHN